MQKAAPEIELKLLSYFAIVYFCKPGGLFLAMTKTEFSPNYRTTAIIPTGNREFKSAVKNRCTRKVPPVGDIHQIITYYDSSSIFFYPARQDNDIYPVYHYPAIRIIYSAAFYFYPAIRI
ncbi:hypothetical protein [Parabacteroides sp. FAFU027]|uniref:hypothetical protein n=1 Tax=Parabacteroides sp. FAFU027 TaxID=2922715 RepID=UPI001FAFBDB1|nr:hypothetical protein [Parabacteroides sp. FAFU027]